MNLLENGNGPALWAATGSLAPAIMDVLGRADICLLNCGTAQGRDRVTSSSRKALTKESIASFIFGLLYVETLRNDFRIQREREAVCVCVLFVKRIRFLEETVIGT